MPDAPAPAPSTATPTPSADVSSMALVTDAATAAPATAPATPAPQAAPQVPQSARERVMARAAERQAQEQARAQEARFQELVALEAAVKAGQMQRVDVDAMEREFLQRFTSDPIGIMAKHKVDAAQQRAFLRQYTQGIINPSTAALQRELEAIKAQQQQPPPQTQQQAASFEEQYAAMRAYEQSIEAFDGLCVAKNGDAFVRPMVARMSREERVRLGDEIASEFHSAGAPFSLDDVADALEERRVALYREVTGEDPPHLRQTPQAGASGSNTSSATSSGGSTATAVLTNDLAAGRPPRAPTSQEERDAAAAQQLAVLFASRR